MLNGVLLDSRQVAQHLFWALWCVNTTLDSKALGQIERLIVKLRDCDCFLRIRWPPALPRYRNEAGLSTGDRRSPQPFREQDFPPVETPHPRSYTVTTHAPPSPKLC